MILYVFFDYNPGGCGVSDVIDRILEADLEAVVLCHHSSAPESSRIRVYPEIEDYLGHIGREIVDGAVFPWLDHKVLPWERKCIAGLGRTRIPSIWWVHEPWRESIAGYSMTLQRRAEQLTQKWRFRRLVNSLRPTTIATTNKRYQRLITEAGYRCELLPNTGTIPVGSQEEGKEYVNSQIADRFKAFVVVSLGNLILDYWDWQTAVKDLVVEAQNRQREAIWVILGLKQDSAVGTIRDFVQAHGLQIDIRYPGQVTSELIDRWLWGADAGISGHPYAVWEKSTGFLAMTERNLPVFVPRMGYPEDTFAKPNPCLFPKIQGLPSRAAITQMAGLVARPHEVAALARKLLGLTRSAPGADTLHAAREERA